MQMIESVDGCRLHAEIEGPQEGPALFLSHQLGGTLASWDAQVAAWRKNFRIIRYDTRGHGASDAPGGDYDIETLGRDALAVMTALDLSRVHFIGLSQGGMTGMWLAANHPQRVEKLVLANTTPFIPNKAMWDELIARARGEGMHAIAASTIEGWLSDGFKKRYPAGVRALIEEMSRMSPTGYAANCAVLRDIDLRDRLADIVCPTLVIGGAEDGPRGAAAPLTASGVKNGKLVIIERAAHLSAIENPEDFNRIVGEFLA